MIRECDRVNDNCWQAFKPGNDRCVETVETIANAKTVGIWGKFEDGQLEQRHRFDLGCRYDALEH